MLESSLNSLALSKTFYHLIFNLIFFDSTPSPTLWTICWGWYVLSLVSSAFLLLGLWPCLSVPPECPLTSLCLWHFHPSGCMKVPLLPQSLPWSDQAPLVSPVALRNLVPYPPVKQILPRDNSFFFFFLIQLNWTKSSVYNTLSSQVHGRTLILSYYILLFTCFS